MNKKGFTLIEVVLSIAMLCVISVVLVSLLVKAHHIERATEKMDMVTLALQNEIEEQLSKDTLEEGIGFRYFDAYFQRCELDERYFTIQTTITQEKRGLYQIQTFMWEDGTKIMSLSTKRYIERADL